MFTNSNIYSLFKRNRKEIKSSAKKLKKSIYLSPKEIQKKVDEFMVGYIDIIPTYQINSLYRGRVWKKEEYPQHINELLCPPIESIRKYGRLNSPKEQILYLAESPQTIYHEIRAKEEDEVILLRIVRRSNTERLQISSLVHDNHSYNPLALNTVRAEALDIVSNEFNLKKLIEIRNQVADILQTEVNEYNKDFYKLTSSFSRNIFKSSINGIIYPSIQTKKAFFNFAAKPSLMETHFIGHTVARVKLKKLDSFKHKVFVIRNGFVNSDGALVWDNSTEFEFPAE